MGDGPGPGELNAEAQHTRLNDTAGHAWTQREHHIVFGSIIDVYTAPATGHEPGSTITSELTIKRGDEGHSLTVLAYRHGRVDSTTRRNGNFGIPQLTQDVPAGTDVLTAFADGRENTPATPVTGFRPLNVLRVDGGPRGDRDLYQLSRLEPPGSWPRRTDAHRQPRPTRVGLLGPGQHQHRLRRLTLPEPTTCRSGHPPVIARSVLGGRTRRR